MGQYDLSVHLKNSDEEIIEVPLSINDALGDLYFNNGRHIPFNFKPSDLPPRDPNEPLIYRAKNCGSLEYHDYIEPVYSTPDNILLLWNRYYPAAVKNLREWHDHEDDYEKFDIHNYSLQLVRGLDQIKTLAIFAEKTNQKMAITLSIG